MFWTDCYIEEGITFRGIDEACQLNKQWFKEGKISSTAYYVTKYKLMRLLINLEDAYTTIYEVHSELENQNI